MKEILPNIKDRVLQLAEELEDTKSIFFRKTGINYSNFTGKSKKSELRAVEIGKILLKYPEVDLHWLLLGKKKEDANPVDIDISGDVYREKYYKVLEEKSALQDRLIKCMDLNMQDDNASRQRSAS